MSITNEQRIAELEGQLAESVQQVDLLQYAIKQRDRQLLEYHEEVNGRGEQLAASKELEGSLREALEMIYDKWENGYPCYEDPENLDGSLGNAFKLNQDEENTILALIPKQPYTEHNQDGKKQNSST